MRIPADVKRAGALGAVNLVGGKRKEVDFELIRIDGNFPARLDAIGVEIDVRLEGDAANFGNGLNRAKFVVRVHDGDENRLGAKRTANVFGINDAIAGNREPGNLNTLFFEGFDGIANSAVLDGRADDVLFFTAYRGDKAEDCQVVGFRAAAGENDFGWLRADQRGNGLAGGFDRGTGVLAGGMNSSWRCRKFQ